MRAHSTSRVRRRMSARLLRSSKRCPIPHRSPGAAGAKKRAVEVIDPTPEVFDTPLGGLNQRASRRPDPRSHTQAEVQVEVVLLCDGNAHQR